MRIERIELDGFGRFHDAHWELPEGLTILLGANEAGKTTLLNGVRALLFGFESSRDGRAWYPAFAGGRRGGRLVIATASGERWTVERHGDRGGGGALAVRAPNGNQGGQETLDRLLHGADKDLFNNIFAFGLAELQTLSSLSAEGVRGRIYGAGAGLGGTSALDLERRLRQQMEATFLPAGSKRPLNALLGRADELRREIADLGRQPLEHAEVTRERDDLRATADSLRAQIRELRGREARIAALRRAAPIAVELAELEADLAVGDASLDLLPEDALMDLDRRVGALERARAVLATIEEQLGDARRRRASIVVDEPILARADEIDAMAAEASQRGTADARMRDLETAEQRAAAGVEEQLSRVGGWAEADLVGLDDSIPAVEATRDHERRLAETRSALAEAESRRRAAADELEARTRELGGPIDGPLSDDHAEQARLLDELDALRVRHAAAEAVAARGSGMGVPSAPLRMGLAVTAGAVAIVLGALLGELVLGIGVGLVLAAITYAMLGGFGRPAASAEGLETLRNERSRLLERLGMPSTAGDAEVRAIAVEVAARRARRELAREQAGALEQRRAELDRREGEVAIAAAAQRDADDGWRAWLGERGIPADLVPEAARHVLAAAGTARRGARDRDHQASQLAEMRAEAAGFEHRARALLARLDLPAADRGQLPALVMGLGQRLGRARADADRAAELDASIAQLAARQATAAGEADERQTALERHVAALGCADEEGVRRRAVAAEARRATRNATRERWNQLAVLAGSGEAVPALLDEARASDPAALAAAASETAETLERMENEEREANARIGALDARLRQLEAAEELGERRQELAMVEGRAAALAREWAVRAVTLRLLEETRSRYERERQPDVVRAAEAHFERITGGRYPRIVAPPGDANVRVEMDGGTSRTTDELSRGTSEQLYLALRFGLIEEFARQAEPLPVVMDDILVNFDPERASRAAAAIRDLADRHQVLYFTCHSRTAELLDPIGERTLSLG